jgi:hypothetical protein
MRLCHDTGVRMNEDMRPWSTPGARGGPGRAKLDWGSAFFLWALDFPFERNNAAFARRMGVHRATLYKRMRRDNWEARAASIHEEAQQRVNERAERGRVNRLMIELFGEGALQLPESDDDD